MTPSAQNRPTLFTVEVTLNIEAKGRRRQVTNRFFRPRASGSGPEYLTPWQRSQRLPDLVPPSSGSRQSRLQSPSRIRRSARPSVPIVAIATIKTSAGCTGCSGVRLSNCVRLLVRAVLRRSFDVDLGSRAPAA